MAARTRRVDFTIGPERTGRHFHWEYDVTIDGVRTVTTVTHNPFVVATWIRNTYNYHTRFNNGGGNDLIVGFDCKGYRPWAHPWGTIQLYAGRRCLVYQISRVGLSPIPSALVDFLRDQNNVFVGVEVLANMAKLRRDYDIPGSSQCIDLGRAAEDTQGRGGLREAGLVLLALFVMGRDYILEEWSWVSNHWDAFQLNHMQVMYAVFHAYLSCEIGRSVVLVHSTHLGNYL